MKAIDLMQFLTDEQAGRVIAEGLDGHKEYDGTPMQRSEIVDLAEDYFATYCGDDHTFLTALIDGGYEDLSDYLQGWKDEAP